MKLFILSVIIFAISGCSSIPLSSPVESENAKRFSSPNQGKAGLYVYRDSFLGPTLKKDIFLNDKCIGASVANVFFYEEIDGNVDYEVSTESEFSPNKLRFKSETGKNHFIRQYIKVGLVVGGAGLEIVSPETGMSAIRRLNKAANGSCGM